MAGAAGNWFKSGKGGTAKGKVFVSNAAIASMYGSSAPGVIAAVKRQLAENPGLADALAADSIQPGGQAKAKAAQATGPAPYRPFDPTNPGPTPQITRGKDTSRQLRSSTDSRTYDVPDLDPVVYEDGTTIGQLGGGYRESVNQMKAWYAEWGEQNAYGTPGYMALTERYQTPVYRAINTYLRMKQDGKTPEQITNELQTSQYVTYAYGNGDIFTPGNFGYYPGNKKAYTYAGMEKIVNTIAASMASLPLPETTVMYRGMARGNEQNPNPIVDALLASNPGDMLPADDAYQSLSLDKSLSLNFATKPLYGGPGVLMTIVVAKGTRGAYLPANDGFAAESEYLLDSGTRYRLLSKTTDPVTGLVHAVLEASN